MSNDGSSTSNEESREDNINGFTRQQKIVLFAVLSGTFVSNTVYGLPAPFLPKLNEEHNLNSDVTGWMLGIFSLVQLIFFPIVAKNVNRIGVRELMCWGLLFLGGCTILFGFLEYMPNVPNDTDWAYVILGFTIRSCQAIGTASFVTAAMTTISIVFPDNTTSMLSLVETVIGLGFMISPAIGSGLYKIGGFMLMFVVIGSVLVFHTLLMFIFLPTNLCPREEKKSVPIMSILKSPRVTSALIFTTFTAMIWTSIDPILEPELRKQYNLKPEISALTFLLLSGVYALTAVIMGKLIEKRKCMNSFILMAVGMFISAIVFLVIGPSPLLPFLERPLWLLLICVGMLGFVLSLQIVPSLDIAFQSDYDDEEETEKNEDNKTAVNGLIAGLWSAAYALGDFGGPAISGMIAKNSSFAWAMTSFAVICFVCFISIIIIFIILTIKKRRRRKLKKQIEDQTHIHAGCDEKSALLTRTDNHKTYA